MAMVSSCIDSVPPLDDARQPVCVEAFSHRSPGPGGPLAHLFKGIGVNESRVALSANDRLVHCLKSLPVLWRDAVVGQAGQIVALTSGVTRDVAPIFTKQAGRVVLGVALDQ